MEPDSQCLQYATAKFIGAFKVNLLIAGRGGSQVHSGIASQGPHYSGTVGRPNLGHKFAEVCARIAHTMFVGEGQYSYCQALSTTRLQKMIMGLRRHMDRYVRAGLSYETQDAEALRRHVDCVEDTDALRKALPGLGLVAFVGNGSVLPRYDTADTYKVAYATAPSFAVGIAGPCSLLSFSRKWRS